MLKRGPIWSGIKEVIKLDLEKSGLCKLYDYLQEEILLKSHFKVNLKGQIWEIYMGWMRMGTANAQWDTASESNPKGGDLTIGNCNIQSTSALEKIRGIICQC